MNFADAMREAAADPRAPEALRRVARFLAEASPALVDVLGPASFGELAARAQLADLAGAVEDFRAACEFSPEFQALDSQHPARRLFRAHERIKVAAGEAFATMADRVLDHATREERAAAALDIVNRRAMHRATGARRR